MDINQKYREETNLDVYKNDFLGDTANYRDDYVKWLEKQLTIPVVSIELPDIVKKLQKNLDEGNSRWIATYEDASCNSQNEMEGYQWALNDIMEAISKGN